MCFSGETASVAILWRSWPQLDRQRSGFLDSIPKQAYPSEFLACISVQPCGQSSIGLTNWARRTSILYQSTATTLDIRVPPRAEQTAIAAFLDHETAKLDALVTEAEQAISLLQERRTALISAAVTGKIDVRGLVDRDEAA